MTEVDLRGWNQWDTRGLNRLWRVFTLWRLLWFLSVCNMNSLFWRRKHLSKYWHNFKRKGSQTNQISYRSRYTRSSVCASIIWTCRRRGGRAGAASEALAAVKPLSVTVIPRSCRSAGVLHSAGSASADYPQYTKGISSPQRAFCWFVPFDTFRVNRRKPEDLPVFTGELAGPAAPGDCQDATD